MKNYWQPVAEDLAGAGCERLGIRIAKEDRMSGTVLGLDFRDREKMNHVESLFAVEVPNGKCMAGRLCGRPQLRPSTVI